MKILVVGPKSERQDAFCRRMKELFPDAEFTFDDFKWSFNEQRQVDLYWYDELAAIPLKSFKNLT